MNTSLVHFQSTDNLRLPGLLYEPTKKTKKVAIFLHGCGSSSIFYKPEMNLLGKAMTDKGIAFFPFNNRGAHYVKTLKRVFPDDTTAEERVLGGAYYEQITDCIKDIDGALDFLKMKGFNTFYLIGHSTGANKIVVYHYYKRNTDVSTYILLAGGDDTGLTYEMLGKTRFKQALRRAKEEIQKGNGERTVPLYMFPEKYSWQSLYDVLNPDGDYNIFPFYEYLHNVTLSTKPLFREYQSVDTPMLVIYGQHDEFCYGNVPDCIKALQKHQNKQVDTKYHIIPDTGHGFEGKEEELANLMVQFLIK